MTITECSRETGFSPHALRYYERAGFIAPPLRRNGVRSYSSEDIDVLRWLREVKRAGISLDALRSAAGRGTLDPRERAATLVHRLLELRSRELELIASLESARASIAATSAELRALTSAQTGSVQP